VLCTSAATARFGGCGIAIGTGSALLNRRSPKIGTKPNESFGNGCKQGTDGNILEIPRQGEKLVFNDWADFFLENFSRPPLRASKTHEANADLQGAGSDVQG
jgi:hypothetical protein